MGIQIHELATKSGNLSSSDYLVTDNGTVTAKIDYTKLAKAIVEQYNGSTLAGSAQTLQSALNKQNNRTKWHTVSGSTKAEILASFDSIMDNGAGFYTSYIGSALAVLLGIPSGGYYVRMSANSANCRSIEFLNATNSTGADYRIRKLNGTWQDPEALPSIDEMKAVWANYGCKNMFHTETHIATVSGITFTVNSDASITVSGTATANAYLTVYNWAALSTTTLASAKGKAVRLSGGTANVRFTVAYRASSSASSTEAKDTGSGASITLPSNESYQIYVALRVTNGVTVNETIYPMICLASIPDDTYVPYAPTNAELYDMIKSLQ
jgi:hypothetical protein